MNIIRLLLLRRELFIQPPMILSKQLIGRIRSVGTRCIRMKRQSAFLSGFNNRLNPLPGQLDFLPMGKESSISKQSIVNQVLVSFRQIRIAGFMLDADLLQLPVLARIFGVQLQ